MDQLARHDTQPGRPEELRLSLEELEKAVNTTPARGVPKLLFIAVAALAAVLGVFAALLCFFDSDYQHNMALARADNEYLRQERDEAQAALTAAQGELSQTQDELTRTQADLAQAQDTIDMLKEYSLAAPDGTVPEYTRLYPDFYTPEWEGEAVTGGNVCYLTFDDGPSANTDRVLEILDRYGVKGTFFVAGNSASTAADCLRSVGRELVVVLCHDSGTRGTTVDALPAVIQGYQNAGYTFSPLHPGVEQVTFGYPKTK